MSMGSWKPGAGSFHMKPTWTAIFHFWAWVVARNGSPWGEEERNILEGLWSHLWVVPISYLNSICAVPSVTHLFVKACVSVLVCQKRPVMLAFLFNYYWCSLNLGYIVLLCVPKATFSITVLSSFDWFSPLSSFWVCKFKDGRTALVFFISVMHFSRTVPKTTYYKYLLTVAIIIIMTKIFTPSDIIIIAILVGGEC